MQLGFSWPRTSKARKRNEKYKTAFCPIFLQFCFFFSIFQNYAHDSHKLCLRLSNGPRRIPQHSLSACTGDSYFFRRATSDEGKGSSINDISKGHLISKYLFVIFYTNKKNDFTAMVPEVGFFSFVFFWRIEDTRDAFRN